MLKNAPLLRLVKDELDSTLQHAEVRLKAYSEGVNEALAETMEAFNQISGTSRLISLPAAEVLAKELHSLAAKLEKLPESDIKQKNAMSGLTVGITMLGRYFSYLNTTGNYSPELLLPTINDVRLAGGGRAYSDSTFFVFEREKKREILRSFVVKPSADLPDTKNLRRLRHMYQVGLLEIIRNNEGGFRLMKRALERVEAICGDTAVAEIWPMAQIAIEAMVMGDVALTRSRKLLFAWLDRELKQLSVNGKVYLASQPSEALVKELCYIIAISAPKSEKIKAAQHRLGFSDDILSDLRIRAERDIMIGPDSSVIQAVSVAVNEELNRLKDAIDLHCRIDGESHSAEIQLLLESIEKTLNLLELDELSDEVKKQLEYLNKQPETKQKDMAIVYEPVIQLVLKIESIMGLMLKGGQLSDAQSAMSDADAAPTGILDEIKMLAVVESRSGLALAKQSLTSYIDSGWDSLYLGNVPDSLHGVWGALYFLNLRQAAEIVLKIQKYIEQKLISSSKPSENDLETLADAVTGVDYYLESIETDKPLGVGILEVAEESLEVLGFPVDK
ncbi:MAG: hypothetical protein JKY01_02375 [Pseudomonadales bacterium]|nr:hypothetical protein [Pseudomonadales bacterium]